MPADPDATQDVAPPTTERMLTAREVADRFGVHVSTVYRLGEKLAAQKFGTGKVRPRGFRVPESVVAAHFPKQDAA